MQIIVCPNCGKLNGFKRSLGLGRFLWFCSLPAPPSASNTVRPPTQSPSSRKFLLLLAVAGIYGVMAYSVAKRTHEIGVRMALGAGAPAVLRLVLGQGMLTIVIGLAIGIAGSFGLTRAMQSLLFGVSATDPLTFAGVAFLLGSAALLA